MELEFLDESPPDDDLADPGPRSPWPRWLGAAVAAMVSVLAVVVVVNRHDPAPGTRRPVAAPTPRLVLAPLPQALVGRDETFAAVYLRATDTARAVDIPRTGSNAGSCPQVRIGSAPQRTAGRAIVTALPGYTIRDTARIIDQNAGLCSLQVRARAVDGTVIVAFVAAPDVLAALDRRQQLSVGATTVGTTAVQYARFISHDGWTVVVGTTGPVGRQPAWLALERLASNPALRW